MDGWHLEASEPGAGRGGGGMSTSALSVDTCHSRVSGLGELSHLKELCKTLGEELSLFTSQCRMWQGRVGACGSEGKAKQDFGFLRCISLQPLAV